jgi:succinyl-CoA synthetase beta subunit
MRLHEYQSKIIFSRYGIPVPKGRVASTASEVKQISEELGGRVVVKAQVLVSGRGKAGGIRLAKTPKEAEELATRILGMEIKGLAVRKVLVDEAVGINKEVYLSVSNDRSEKKPVLIASATGAASVEEVLHQSSEKVIRTIIDPLLGLRDYQARDIAVGIDLPRSNWRAFMEICNGLWRAYRDNDATLAEINPLVVTSDQRLLTLDAKMEIDDNALFRHIDLMEIRDLNAVAPIEEEARKYGLCFAKLDGNIGCLVNGAGLAMATMDLIKMYGGEPANFLDIGGGAGIEKVASAFKILLSDTNLHGVLINIFGGITQCDEVAKGILSAMESHPTQIPIVARLEGANSDEGIRLLSETGIIITDSLVEAAQKIIQAARGN